MKDLPHGGATFESAHVSERGRRFLGTLLHELTDAQLTDLFTWARFDKPRSRHGDEAGVGLGSRVQDSRARDQRGAAVSRRVALARPRAPRAASRRS